MYPILATSLFGLWAILERAIWWGVEESHREDAKLDEVLGLLEKNNVDAARDAARASNDAVLRVLWFGLSHRDRSSLQGAFQVAAGIELQRAGRFVVVLDTIVTLAPLLGLLGTVTGLMRAFFKLGSTELTEEAIGGGIAEALIATACGLSIAVVCLIFLNYYANKVGKLQFALQAACGKAEVLLHHHAPERKEYVEVGSSLQEAPDSSSLMPPTHGSMNTPTI